MQQKDIASFNMTVASHIEFKKELGTYLKTIADEPLTHGYTARRSAESSSLIQTIYVD